MNEHPKVSVCIPSYNHARFLPAALESVLAQTHRDFEVIVTDDGSTDDSLQIAESYAARYPSLVRVFTHPGRRNMGIGATANLNLSESRGEYWAGLSSDDAWYPDKLARQIAFLDSHPKAGFVYGLAQTIDGEGRMLPQIIGNDISRDADPVARLVVENPIPSPSVMARRLCFDRLGAEDASLVYSDWELLLRFLAHWDAGFIDQPLLMYRIHDYNTSVGIEPELKLKHLIEFITAVKNKAPTTGGALLKPHIQALINLQHAFFSFCAGNELQAEESFAAAFVADAAMGADVKRFAKWLEAKHGEELYFTSCALAECRFGAWALAHLPAQTAKSFAKQTARLIIGWQSAALASEHYRSGDLPSTRQVILKGMANDPQRFYERNMLSIFIESIIGSTTMKRLRNLKKSLPHRQ